MKSKYPTTLKEKMVFLELLNVWTEPTFQSVLQKKAQLLTSIERDSTGFNDVCRENMTFTHIFVGFPGSCHDARILRNSDLWKNWFKYLWPGPYCCRWSLSNSKMVTYTVQGQWPLNSK